MLKTIFAGASLLTLTALVGCAAEPVAVEENGESASRQATDQSTGDLDAQAERDLDRLEAKANRCGQFTPEETRLIDRYRGHVDWTFEAYVTLTCTYSTGGVLAANYVVSRNMGWSSADQFFTEHSVEGNLALTLDLRMVSGSVTASKTLTVRQSGLEVETEYTEPVTVGVTRNLAGAEVGGELSFEGNEIKATAGASIPVLLRSEDCNGDQRVGLKVSLGGERISSVSRDLEQRAQKIFDLDHLTEISRSIARHKGETFCCNYTNDNCPDGL